MTDRNSEYAKVHTEFIRPEQPKGYWLTVIELENGARLGFWRGDTKEESLAGMERWRTRTLIEGERIRQLTEWRAKHWWRRVFQSIPPHLESATFHAKSVEPKANNDR